MAQTGYIYKLASNDLSIKEVYVGSTKNLRVRKGQHRHRCNNENCSEYNFRVYQYIRENGGFSNWDIIQLESIEYNTRYELRARERYYIESLKASLNKAIPNRTSKEYKNDHKETRQQQSKEYYKNNMEEIKQKVKLYTEKHKEQIKQNRKEYFIEYQKKFREKNKEIKTVCECGSQYLHYTKKRHLDSKKHKDFISVLTTNMSPQNSITNCKDSDTDNRARLSVDSLTKL